MFQSSGLHKSWHEAEDIFLLTSPLWHKSFTDQPDPVQPRWNGEDHDLFVNNSPQGNSLLSSYLSY